MTATNLVSLADYDTTERVAANSDLIDATKAAKQAIVRSMTFELATVAQIALEHGYSRGDTILIAAEKSTGAAYAKHIRPSGGRDGGLDNVPAEWTDDLTHFTADDLDDQLGFVTWVDEYLEVEIGRALSAEKALLGPNRASSPSIFVDRRGAARQAVNDARDKAAHAAAHLTMLDILEVAPHAKAARFAIDPDRDMLVLVEVLDSDRNPITDEDVTDFVDAYDNGYLTDYTDIEALNLTADDVIDSGVALGTFDGSVLIPFDAVRRLRGVADDPNQPSLFEHDHPADYGWQGRAA